MASVCQSLAIAESARSSSSYYGARMPCFSPFHQRPFYLKVRDLHFSSHSNSLVFFSSGQLCISVATTAEATQQELLTSAKDGAVETAQDGAVEMAASSDNATKTPSLPNRYIHLTELFFQLCEGADVPSAMDPWLQKLTLADWNQLIVQCGRKDTAIAKQIMAFFREKEAVLDQHVLFKRRNEEQASTTEASTGLSRESDAESSEKMLEDAAEAPEEATLQEKQEGPTGKLPEVNELDQDTIADSFADEVEQTTEIISPPSLKLYTTLARVLTRKRKFDEVDAVEMEVKEAGLELDVHYYNVLLESYTERRSLSKAIELFQHIKSLGFEPHIYVHQKLAYIYMNEGDADLEVLKEFAEDLRSRNSTAAAMTIYKNLLKVHWEANDVAGAEEAFEALVVTGYTPEMKDLLKLMQLNGRRGNHERVVELVELMVKCGCKPNASVYDYLIHAYCRAGLLEKAKDTFLKFESVLGTKPTAISINMLIDGYGKQGLYEEALEMFDSIKQHGYRPTQVSYSSIVSAVAKVGKLQSAVQLYDNMLKSGIQPNLHTYSTLIRLYTKYNLTREGHKIYRAMRRAPYKMTDTAYSVALALYVDGTWYHQAAALLKEIEEKGVDLEAIAHSSLIRSFSYLESRTTPLARAVRESEMKICKLLTSLFDATLDNQELESSVVEAVFSTLEEWRGVASLEARALVFNTFIDYFWRKGYKEIAMEILRMGRQLYAGYSRSRLLNSEWILDVRGLGIGGAKVALRDWLFGEQEMLAEKGGDDTKMVLITGDEFSLTLPHDNTKVKSVISSLLAELDSPFVSSPSSPDRLEATLADVFRWVAEMRLSKPPSLF